jgi:hypothetical protein
VDATPVVNECLQDATITASMKKIILFLTFLTSGHLIVGSVGSISIVKGHFCRVDIKFDYVGSLILDDCSDQTQLKP